MRVKDEVLKTLENNKGIYFSGADLAEELNVSRNAVWKAIKSLQAEGHKIAAVTNKGYCLAPDSDILSVPGIRKYLSPSCRNLSFKIFESVSSTNTLLKEMAAEGAEEGTVIIAQKQTHGRGRLGRKFYAPCDTGIYFSILLRPDMPAGDSLFLTTSAAVAVAKSIETVSGRKADIKWVNDVYINGKKVCGILTEGAFNTETAKLDYTVTGIGVNICPPDGGFPDDIKDIADSVFASKEDSKNSRNRLIAEILNLFMDYYKNFHNRTFFEEYKKRSFIVGKEIYVVDGSDLIPATALDIDEECHLIVKYEDGTIKNLSSGEVSIKVLPPKDSFIKIQKEEI